MTSKMDRQHRNYDQKLAAIKEILEDIGYDDVTFGGFKAILTVEPKPSEKYLDSCFDVIHNMLKISSNMHSAESDAFHDKLVKWEKALQLQEGNEKQQEKADDILKAL